MTRSFILVLAFPVTLLAQATVSVAPFVAMDRSLSTTPLLLGASMGVSLGPIGLRGSGSVAHAKWQLSDTTTATADQAIKAFAGDVDLVINPGRAAGAAGAFGSLDPRLFAGYGIRGEAIAGGARATHRVVSVGSSLSYSVLSRLRLDVEARRLVPVEAVSGLFDGSRGAWEYRAGMSLHFGKGNMRPSRGILRGIPGLPGSSGSADRGPRAVATPAAGTLLATANKQIGTPYVWGGTSPNKGLDCSGFVQYVFRSHGVPLPRTSREMALRGKSVGKSMEALQPGDLMFFSERGDGITHVAIYAGNNMMVHSSKSGNGVGYDDLTTPRGRWYKGIYAGGQRVLGQPIDAVVTMAGSPRGGAQAGRVPTRSLAQGGARGGIAEFLKAAGMSELSDVGKRLYRPDEKVDGPDGAPQRRW